MYSEFGTSSEKNADAYISDISESVARVLYQEEERIKKENYLREEILIGNYSPEIFREFLKLKKRSDIDLLSMKELTDCLKEFKESYNDLEIEFSMKIEEETSRTKRKKDGEQQEKERKNIEDFDGKEIENITEKDILAECIKEDFSSDSGSEISSPRMKKSPSIKPFEHRTSNNEFILTLDGKELLSEDHSMSDSLNDSLLSESSQNTLKRATLEQEFLSRIKKTQSPKMSPHRLSPPEMSIDTKVSKDRNSKEISPLLLDSSLLDAGVYLHQDVYKIESIKIPDNELSMKTCEVVISDPEKSNAVYYTITTIPLGWVVKRHLNDFSWLRTTFAFLYPGVYIPPPLPKKWTGKDKDDTLVKDQRFLQRFINSAISHPLLKKSPYLFEFLKEQDYSYFETFKKDCSKLKRPEFVEFFPTLEGFSYCDASSPKESSKDISDFITLSQTLQKKIKRRSNKLEEQLTEISISINKLSKTIKKLQKAQELISNNRKNSELFRLFSQTMAAWAKCNIERVKSVKEHMSSFFKYTYNEVLPIKDIIKEKEINFQNYLKADKKIKIKKEKLWAQGDVSKWEIESREPIQNLNTLQTDKELAFHKMLTQESQKVQKLKDLYAYYNYKLNEESLWFIPFNANRNIKEFREFAKKEIAVIWKLKQTWESFSEKLARLEDDQSL
ncbi:unnamed protein product [Blepharisma stoltei]|uniref:PX domain-containing protein n=1 Tax=Blepharisma stoltei TaxID=1481888 RepID=A0AAU9JPY5_9CILI|nr:unnamed protein product [Blepharisma stoltei]